MQVPDVLDEVPREGEGEIRPRAVSDHHDVLQREADGVQQVVEAGKQGVLLLLAGLVGGFAVIRASTRLIRARAKFWPGNVHVGGVHVHHLLVGVVLMALCGGSAFLPLSNGPHDWLAFGFGVGADAEDRVCVSVPGGGAP